MLPFLIEFFQDAQPFYPHRKALTQNMVRLWTMELTKGTPKDTSDKRAKTIKQSLANYRYCLLPFAKREARICAKNDVQEKITNAQLIVVADVSDIEEKWDGEWYDVTLATAKSAAIYAACDAAGPAASSAASRASGDAECHTLWIIGQDDPRLKDDQGRKLSNPFAALTYIFELGGIYQGLYQSKAHPSEYAYIATLRQT